MQVIGKLPFDDVNHKKLLRLILSGPVFPPHRESSLDFQDLVVLILMPENQRIGIPEIRRSTWYIKNESLLHERSALKNVEKTVTADTAQ